MSITVSFYDRIEIMGAKWTIGDWKKAISEWDSLLRSGRVRDGRRKLEKVRLQDVPRAQLAEFAALCRRANLWETSLTALKPHIYPKIRSRESSSPRERIEYAMALRRAGALIEAESILTHEALATEPRAMLALAQNQMVQWRYGEALARLDECLESGVLTPYEALVARVNRLACMAYVDAPAFDAEAAKVEQELRAGSFNLLLGNLLEIAAQKRISERDYKAAETVLSAAENILGGDGGPYLNLVRKWQNIVKAVSTGSTQDLLLYRAEALKVNDWETLRHLDFYVTRLEPDSVWANRVYYGTPYATFRQKLEAARPFADEDWILHSPDSTAEFDPWFPGREEGEYLHRLLVMLLKDWYRPISIGGIFDGLYRGEHFDIERSAGRIRQHLGRLKTWLTKNNVPLRLYQIDGQYGLRTLAKAKIRARKRGLSFGESEFFFGRYLGRVPAVNESREWSKILNLSSRQTLYALNKGMEDGWIVKEQKGRYTRYRLIGRTDPI